MLDVIKKLREDAWTTAGARYNAARRFKRRNLFSIISLSSFSAISVGLVFIQKIYSPEAGSPLDNYLTALTVCLSLFLLVVSLVEWGAGNSVKVDRLHQNAEELSAFWRRLDLELSKIDPNGISACNTICKPFDLLKEYEEIKAKCGFNHDPLDYRLFLVTPRSDPEKSETSSFWSLGYFRSVLYSYFSSVWYFLTLWLIILGLICLTPWG